MKRSLLRVVLVALAASSSLACRSLPDEVYPGNTAAGVRLDDQAFGIMPGDLLEIRFPAYPQWNAEMLVRPDGRCSVPLVGELLVEGCAIEKARAEIEGLLAARIRSPRIELTVKEQRSRFVYVGGEVEVPGPVPLGSESMSLGEAVFAAGGPLRETARLGDVVLSRPLPDGRRVSYRVDLAERLASSAPWEPVLLVPGDVIFVPDTGISEINTAVAQYIDRMIPAQNLVSTGIVLSAAK